MDTPAPSDPLRFGRFELRPHERQLLVDGTPATLGARAFDVLLTLARRAGELVSKHELLDAVWPELVVEESNLHVQVSSLRKLLGPEPIATIPGRGYRFTARVEAPASERAPGAPKLPSHLPAALPALIGRDDDRAALGALVEQHRLLSLVGAGGIGKTRLAQQLLHDRREAYAHGVCWVDLTALDEPARCASAIASALGVQTGSEALRGLAGACASLSLLMVLDNAEHLIDEVARIAQALVEAAPGLRLVVTSQAPLRLAGERVYRVGPLALPEQPVSAAEAMEYGAVALFVERAQAADRRFVLDDGNVALVVDICRQLDATALSIELAAARVRLLGLQGLAQALGERLRVLTGGQRSAPQRQQTLRAALEWSHALLSDAEQTVFRRLAVFAGGCTLPLLQAVVSDDALDEWQALDALDLLVERSLVAVDDDEPRRYRLLESPRLFALERLEAAGERDALRARHAHAFAAHFARGYDDLFCCRRRTADCLRELQPDADNARAAHAWALAHAPQQAVALAPVLLELSRGQKQEAAALWRSTEAQIDERVPARLRAYACYEAALLFYRRPALGAPLATRAVQAFEEIGDRLGLFRALARLATIDPRSERARAALLRMREVADASWSPGVLRHGANAEHIVAIEIGQYDEALHWVRRQVALDGEDGDWEFTGLVNLANCELATGDVAEAIAVGRRLLERLRGTRWEDDLALARLNLCAALLAADDAPSARPLAAEGWAQAARFHFTPYWADYLALLAALEGRAEAAAQIAGFADAAYAAAESQERQVNEARAVGRACDFARAMLGSEGFDELHALGALLDSEAVNRLLFGRG